MSTCLTGQFCRRRGLRLSGTQRLRAGRGFTLIEVLVVVAIIALLLAILLPSLRRARDQARTLMSATNLHTSGQAMVYYTQANRDVFCSSQWAESIHQYIQRFSAGKKTKEWAEPLNGNTAAYVEFYLCPGDEIYHTSGAMARNVNGRCMRLQYPTSYAINDALLYKVKPSMLDALLKTESLYVDEWSVIRDPGVSFTVDACDGSKDEILGGIRKAGSVKRPSEILMFMDSGDDDMEIPTGRWEFDQKVHDNRNLQVHHVTGNNFLYVDGHVSFVKVIRGAYQWNMPPWPWAWIPIDGWQINRKTNKFNPYGQDYSKY